METLLEFAKHNQVKKTLNQWSKEDKKQKNDKFWNDYYLSTVPRGVYIQNPKDARHTDFGAIGYPN